VDVGKTKKLWVTHPILCVRKFAVLKGGKDIGNSERWSFGQTVKGVRDVGISRVKCYVPKTPKNEFSLSK